MTGRCNNPPRPVIGIRIEALAGEKEIPQTGNVVAAEICARRIFALDGADGGGSREQYLHPVFLDDPPELAGVRSADGLALVDDRGAAEQEGEHKAI